jgi:3-oxoacyl-[acyl-carrier protein] reductase
MPMQSAPVAIITGGKGALATALREHLEELGWIVHAPGREALDVTQSASVANFFAGIDRIDLMVNNAGIRHDALLARQAEADRDAVLDVSLRGAFLCCRAAAAIMSRGGSGHIVNIGSHSALSGPAGQTAYAAAKAGLAGLTKSLAAELGPAGIRVNCILPGWLETKFTRDVPEAARDNALDGQTLGRFNTVADAARFIAFLHSMGAVSGQVFLLDSRIFRHGV